MSLNNFIVPLCSMKVLTQAQVDAGTGDISRMPLVILKPVLFEPMLFQRVQRVFSPFAGAAGVPLVLFKPVVFKPVPFVARTMLFKPVLFKLLSFTGPAPFKGATSLTP